MRLKKLLWISAFLLVGGCQGANTEHPEAAEGAYQRFAAPEVAPAARPSKVLSELLLTPARLPDYTLLEDHERSLEEVANAGGDAKLRAQELLSHGYQSGWLREFKQQTATKGRAVTITHLVSQYADVEGALWAVGRNVQRIQALPMETTEVLAPAPLRVFISDVGEGATQTRMISVLTRQGSISYSLTVIGLVHEVDVDEVVGWASVSGVALRNAP